MKNFIKTSTIALVILSLFAVSCEKPKRGDVPAPPKADMEATVTWTRTGSAKPETVPGDKVIYGEVGKAYLITPKLNVTVCASGIWSITVEGPAGSSPGSSINEATGAAGVTLFTKGTYKIKITYKCPGCTEISITITIKVE